MDKPQISERLGSHVEDLRDRAADVMKADGGAVFKELRGLASRLDDLADRVGDLASQLGDAEDRLDDRLELLDEAVSASRRTTWPRRVLYLAVGAGLGAGAAYLADPDRGRARRDQLGDQLAARAREVSDQVGDQAKIAVDRAKGAAVEAAKDVLPEDVPEDPKVLEQRVRSHALGGRDDTQDVVLRVDGPGRVALKGTVPSAESERELLLKVAEVEGVTDVRSELATRGA